MAWLFLIPAIMFEVLGTSLLKLADGMANPKWLVISIGAYTIAFLLLSQVLRYMSVGVAYAIWAGLGTSLVVLVGILVYGESASIYRLACIALIVVGTVGLNLTGIKG